jgi:hypothetical protein
LKIVAFSSFKHLEYVRDVTQVPVSNATRGLIAIDSSGVPQGVILLDNWTENCVTGHIAIQKPMALRELLPELCDYVYHFCGKSMILAGIADDTPKALKLVKNIGFKEIYRIKDGWDVGIDLVLTQMTKDDCRHTQKIKEVA